jgi:hypothetical protein
MKFKCGCGSYNYNRGDWLAHFKHGQHGVWRAVKHLLFTRIEL